MNWLKPYMTPPAAKANTPAEGQEFAAKLAAFKTAHGFRERFGMVCHCSRFGKSFQVLFERANEIERFEVSSITKLPEQGTSQGCSGASDTKTFNADLLGMSGWSCPYCRASGWISCPCGSNTCSYQLHHAQDRLHRCEPGCGAVATPVPLKEMTGSAASSAPAALASRASPALPGPGRAGLPPSNSPRLPWRGK